MSCIQGSQSLRNSSSNILSSNSCNGSVHDGFETATTSFRLIQQARLVADDVEGVVVPGSGHWLMEEAPDQVIPKVVSFLAREDGRLAPADITALDRGGPGAGSSGVTGIQTTVLYGDPSCAGLYTIRLSVPANTRIEAHSHRDDRSVTVVSGVWYFGYGSLFLESALVALPAGSFYTEPPNRPHFARTLAEPVVVYITGYGPTDTNYVDSNDAPGTE